MSRDEHFVVHFSVPYLGIGGPVFVRANLIGSRDLRGWTDIKINLLFHNKALGVRSTHNRVQHTTVWPRGPEKGCDYEHNFFGLFAP